MPIVLLSDLISVLLYIVKGVQEISSQCEPHGRRRLCIRHLAFTNLLRDTASKLTSFLACSLIWPHAQTGCSKCRMRSSTAMSTCCLHNLYILYTVY